MTHQQIVEISLRSDYLAANLLGDPATRSTYVYLPTGESGAGLPLLVYLAGFGSSGLAQTCWRGFSETLPQRVERLIRVGMMPPVVLAFPDCFTALGGNQYIDSAATGCWGSYLAKELVPAIETRFGCGGKGRRGVFGKSSGGYGALAQAFTFPEVWDAAACHSGDMAFELCYLPLMPDTLRVLARHEMSTAKFLDHCADTRKCGRGLDKQAQVAMMVLAMAATYAPNPDLPYGVELPVDLNTCKVIPERWQRWLDCEPEAILARRPEALSGLRALWIDCGRQDTANLLYGARRLEVALVARGVDHVYEEFEGGHIDTNYRFDNSLPFLAQALARNTEIVDV